MSFSEVLEIRLPDQSSDFFQKIEYCWILECRDSQGKIQAEYFDSSIDCLFVEVEKGEVRPFSIRAEPLGASSVFFSTKPAGFIYGVDPKKRRDYFFDWERGFLSLLLLDVSEFMDPRQVNIERLMRSISDIAEGDNSWILDKVLMQEQLLSGEFRVYDIRKLRMRSIELQIPLGYWFNANLLGDNILVTSAESPVLIDVFTGNNLYYHEQGLCLEIEMNTNGSYEYIIY